MILFSLHISPSQMSAMHSVEVVNPLGTKTDKHKLGEHALMFPREKKFFEYT